MKDGEFVQATSVAKQVFMHVLMLPRAIELLLHFDHPATMQNPC